MADRFARIPGRAAGVRALSGGDLRVLVAIAVHADGEGRAYPSMSTIAEMTGMRREDIPRAVRHLEDVGLLRRDSRAGVAAVNVYVVILDGAEVSAPPLTGVRNAADTVSANLRTEVSAPPLTGCPQIDTSGVRSVAYQTNNNKPKNRLSAQKRADARHVEKFAEDDFDWFWRNYPSRGSHTNPKKPAREKFSAAVNRGVDPKLIVRATINYSDAVSRNGTEGRYVKQAQFWLTQECWEQYADPVDNPEPLRAGMI